MVSGAQTRNAMACMNAETEPRAWMTSNTPPSANGSITEHATEATIAVTHTISRAQSARRMARATVSHDGAAAGFGERCCRCCSWTACCSRRFITARTCLGRRRVLVDSGRCERVHRATHSPAAAAAAAAATAATTVEPIGEGALPPPAGYSVTLMVGTRSAAPEEEGEEEEEAKVRVVDGRHKERTLCGTSSRSPARQC
jgi:hypothetical protein